MVRWLVPIRAEAPAEAGSGTCKIKSPYIYPPDGIDYIRIPIGLKVKIWAKRISGDECKFKITLSRDGGSTFPETLTIEYNPAPGEVALEKRRPIVVKAFTGQEAIRIDYEKSSTNPAYFELEIEFTDEEDDE